MTPKYPLCFTVQILCVLKSKQLQSNRKGAESEPSHPASSAYSEFLLCVTALSAER